MSVLKIKTYKYRQNDRLDKMDPLHSIAPVWVQKLRSYSWKTKILKIAAVFKNGAIDGENMTFLAYLAFLCFWRRRLMFIVKKTKIFTIWVKGGYPLNLYFFNKTGSIAIWQQNCQNSRNRPSNRCVWWGYELFCDYSNFFKKSYRWGGGSYLFISSDEFLFQEICIWDWISIHRDARRGGYSDISSYFCVFYNLLVSLQPSDQKRNDRDLKFRTHEYI